MDYCIGFLSEGHRYKVYFINLSTKIFKVHLESMDMYGEYDDKPIQSTIASQDLKDIKPSSATLIEEGDVQNLDSTTIFSVKIDGSGKEVESFSFTLPSYIRAKGVHTDNLPFINKKGLILNSL
jgi:hypothetical protein